MNGAKRILIVEDDREINQMLASFLRENGYETDSAYNGAEASSIMMQKEYTLVLMDLMLPYKGGADLIGELREHSNTPVIVLSAKSMMETRLQVLRLGADDYIMKPFDLDEVLVRMEVVLRRSGENQGGTKAQSKQLVCADLIINIDTNRVTIGEKELSLTAKEFAILKLFLENSKKTFTKANLYETIWGETYYPEDNTLNVHMSNLRNKLKKAGSLDYIETVWGIGYKLHQEA